MAVGLLRPPHVFFYEVDCKRGKFRTIRRRFLEAARKFFNYWSLFRTKHGYHLIAYPYSRKVWRYFKRNFRSDFTMKLKARWGRKEPQVLRISSKFDIKTGDIVSLEPKLIRGNFFLQNISKYKVFYYAK